jgi:hypothetical protein
MANTLLYVRPRKDRRGRRVVVVRSELLRGGRGGYLLVSGRARSVFADSGRELEDFRMAPATLNYRLPSSGTRIPQVWLVRRHSPTPPHTWPVLVLTYGNPTTAPHLLYDGA